MSEPFVSPLIEAVRRMRRARDLAAMRRQGTALNRAVDRGDFSGDPDAAFVRDGLDQVLKSRTPERARYYIDRLLKGLTEQKYAPNSDLDLRRWKQYDDLNVDSLWRIAARDRSSVHRADYWGNFVPQIPNQLMRRFTRRGEWVLDPFAGSGTTLIECLQLGRYGLGIELQAGRARDTRKLLAAAENPHSVQVEVCRGDSRRFDVGAKLRELGVPGVQLAILHPPYHDIIRFSDDAADLSNQESPEAFIAGLTEVARRAADALDPGRMLALVIGDKYASGEWIPLGFMAMQALTGLGLKLKSIVVKDFEKTTGKRGQEELWRYRALAGGFYVFKHEYVFLFQKPG